MSKIYIIRDGYAERVVTDRDIEAFQEYVEEFGLLWHSHEFDNEIAETDFISGLYDGYDERAPTGFIVLYESIDEDRPFIEILVNQ